MPVVSGTVQNMNHRGPYSGAYGDFYSHSLNVNGEWYSAIDKTTTLRTETGAEVTQGAVVEFIYDTKVGKNGKPNQNINKKTLAVVQEGKAEVLQENVQAATQTVVAKVSPVRSYQDNSTGAAVGMSWNCAWSEAVSQSQGAPIDLDYVKHRAVEIYKASQEVKEYISSGKHLEELPFTPDEVHPET